MGRGVKRTSARTVGGWDAVVLHVCLVVRTVHSIRTVDYGLSVGEGGLRVTLYRGTRAIGVRSCSKCHSESGAIKAKEDSKVEVCRTHGSIFGWESLKWTGISKCTQYVAAKE